MKILITGTTGFVGRNVKEYFETRYKQVYCPKRAELNLYDSEAVKNYLHTHKFDVVLQCAVTLNSVEENLKIYFNIERCSETFGKMICVGSGAEYDPRHYLPMMTEDYFGKEIPTDIYGFSKYVIAKDIENTKKNIYNLRVFGIYGKYENYSRRFISNNICRVLANQNISMNRNMKFDYLYVNDFVKLLDLFVGQQPKHHSYNLCTSTPIDLYTLAEYVKAAHGKQLEIAIKQDGMNPEYSGDNSRFMKEFGNFEFCNHQEAIKELYNWYKFESKIRFDELVFN
ncbi:MAG: NAD-dependent epimerase/dehydratase family protein [Bacteriovoracia bacterium]